MMKKIFAAIVLISLVFAAGCSADVTRYQYTYAGENDLWTAEFNLDATETFTEGSILRYDCVSDKTLTITYKNDVSDLANVRLLEISYETSAGGGRLTQEFTADMPMEKTYTLNGGAKGGAIEREDEIITVTIALDGEAKTLQLENIS